MRGMADRDPAFLWETEVLRTSARSASPSPPPPTGPSERNDWLTLRRASEETGIPVSTLRNWARKGRIPTTLDETPSGPRRMVSLQGVRERARRLGQERGETRSAPPVAAADSSMAMGRDQVSTPPGTMLVPIDAWDKMLIQLGNLHQAGQQLAEARERAARAETEAAFLRERLAELREARTGPEESPPPTSTAEPLDSNQGDPEPAKQARIPSFTAYLWRLAVSERRRR